MGESSPHIGPKELKHKFRVEFFILVYKSNNFSLDSVQNLI